MVDINLFSGIEWIQDILAVVLTILAIQLFISLNDLIKNKEILSTTFTRKFIHIFAAPIYLFMWPLYSDQWFSPYFAAIVPLLFAVQFSLIGFDIIENKAFVNSMSRSGDPRELLKGTLYYAIVMIIVTLFFFIPYPISPTHSPVAIVTLMVLAFGDGFADIVGRTLNTMNFTIIAKKSVPGTIAMLVSSIIGSFLGLAFFGFPISDLISLVLLACIVGTIVEALSPPDTDNLTVPLAVILVFLLFSSVLADVSWTIL